MRLDAKIAARPPTARCVRALVAAIVTIALGTACNPRGQEQLRAAERGPNESGTIGKPVASDTTAGVEPGIHPAAVLGELHNPYANNPAAAAEGRQLFVQYNCSGCHGGRAGGGMGPSLRDSAWTYGDSDTQIYDSIFEGRPAGMPTWGPRISADQIWKIIAYIRTLNTPREPDRPPPPAQPPLLPSQG